ncbi:hypothetical protein [Alicyclobacillus mengziensis]|uniref:SWIM-type domain-containing protein n=1 Tax=Alicyclobacillus mengziensis TaxID=2931921 RepID=A0A9X7W149_9BACL|nr:hypothetical protein [Alicyclobacillus mengziensis]QSO47423.1 hypothetical protein JZ786_24070 [Alicyclobacillus mengziensis]
MAFVVERSDAAQVVEEFCAVYPAQMLVNAIYYCEESCVLDVAVKDRLVSARVHGKNDHLVTLQLDFAHLNSTCDCGQEGGCEHIAAVAFTLFAKYGDARTYLEQRNAEAKGLVPNVQNKVPRSGVTAKVSGSGVGGDRDSGSDSGSDSLSEEIKEMQRPSGLAEEQGLAEWISYLDDLVEWRYERRNRVDLRDLSLRMDEWSHTAENWETQKYALFTVVAGLVVIREANRMLQRKGSSEELHRFMRSMSTAPDDSLLDAAMDDIYDAVTFLHEDSLGWLKLQSMSPLIELVRSVVLHPGESGMHLTAFKVVWSWLLFHVAEPRDEISRLAVHKRRAEKSQTELLPSIKQAIAFLHILNGDDESARAELAGIGLPAVVYVVPLLDSMKNGAQGTERVYHWLQFISPILDSDDWSQHQLIHKAADAWVNVATQLPYADEACFVFLKLWVEVVYETWEDYLIQTERYEDFVDYYMAFEIPLSEAKPQHLQRLESKAPYALLPYYHQLIERYVQEKKREAYRDAAKLLKQLKTLYRRQKRLPDWEKFISGFVERYGRLRALMEEMQKGGVAS